ncbi:MAG: membrane protein insertase YidC [Oscillospiraceae bacterium]|jgi:YidC/Oxa1 family membrane protein insertase|nr:membrane protein insertase YidC [Oscillospiraceae bacterium]
MLRAIAQPFGWLLLKLYEVFGNYGVAVILFALIVKVVLLPFQMKSKRGMMQQSQLQPLMKELEKKHGANKAKYNEELAKLYKEEGVNPASGCVWSLIPLPILLALYYAIRYPITTMMGIGGDALNALLARMAEVAPRSMWVKLGLDASVKAGSDAEIAQAQFIGGHFANFANIEGIGDKLRQVDYNFLGMDIGSQPSWKFLWTTDWGNPAVWGPQLGLFLIPIVTGILTFLSSRIGAKMNPMQQQEGQGQGSMKMMMYLMPLMTVYFGFVVPAALGIYWAAGSVFGIAQDVWLNKRYTRILEAENAEKNARRRAKEAQLEAKRLETERKKAESATEINPNTSKRKRQVSEKHDQLAKASEWDKKHTPDEPEYEPSRQGARRFARGRAYDPDRFNEEDAQEGGEE